MNESLVLPKAGLDKLIALMWREAFKVFCSGPPMGAESNLLIRYCPLRVVI